MKKLFIMALATVLMGSTAMAQENNSEKKEKMNANRTEMIKKRTEATAKRYGLDEAQTARLLQVNIQYADQMGPRAFGMQGRRPGGMHPQMMGGAKQRPEMKTGKELTEEQKAKREERRQKMGKDMNAYNDSLRAIFTEDQYKAYTDDLNKRRQMPQRRN